MIRTVVVTTLVLLVGAVPAGAREPEVASYPALTAVRDLAAVSHAPRVVALDGYPALRRPSGLAFPSPASLRAARRYAAVRRGRVSFAVADRQGGIRGRGVDRAYHSASLVKAMLLAAHLKRAGRRRLSGRETKTLDAMIRISDNESAYSVYGRLGPTPVRALARRVGMRSFAIDGSWSDSRVTAADQSRFFLSLNRLLPGRGARTYARYLLGHVVAQHSWGIPRAARPRGWRVFFKGGWRPEGRGELVHQAALLERRGRRVAIAVLSDGNPSEPYGRQTVRGIATRLLRRAPSARRARRVARPGRLAPLRALAGYRAPEPKVLRALTVRGK